MWEKHDPKKIYPVGVYLVTRGGLPLGLVRFDGSCFLNWDNSKGALLQDSDYLMAWPYMMAKDEQ